MKPELKNPKPGQKYETPPKTDPLYRFYVSLMKQKQSAMATKWCLEHGVFSEKKATQIDAMLKMEKLAVTRSKMKH